MQRRYLLKAMAAVGAGLSLPHANVFGQTAVSNTINVKHLFNQAIQKDDALIGLADVQQNYTEQSLKIDGKLPKDIRGYFYRNGPAKHERGEQRYQHLFEGDGMLQRFAIGEGKIKHIGKFVNTPKYAHEESAKRFMFDGPDTKLTVSSAVAHADTINTANTNIIPVGDDLWALWEGGSASVIDKASLSFKNFANLGENSQYGDKLKRLPFSAHPKIEANGDIWNFGYNAAGTIVLYHLSAQGKTKNVGLINTDFRAGMLHDFLITHKHILLILPSIAKDASAHGMFASIRFNKHQPMKVMVLDKNTLKMVRQYELPPGFAFHFGNAWEETDGSIYFDASLYSDVKILHEMSHIMQGKHIAIPATSNTCLYHLKTNGSVDYQKLKENSEFPRVSNYLTGLKNRYLYHVGNTHDGLWSDSIYRVDWHNDTVESYYYGKEYIVEEHIPIAQDNNENNGYLIGTALHVPSKRTCLNIFNVAKLSDGPITRAWLPYHLPLGFHGNYSAA